MATDELQKTFASSVEDLDTMYEESGNIGLDMALTNGKGIPVFGISPVATKILKIL